MSDNRISPEFRSTAGDAVRGDAAPRASLAAHLIARLRAGKFDRMLSVGAPVPAGSALAVHAARVTSVSEREAVARALREAVHDAHRGSPVICARIPVHRANVLAAEHLIDDVTLRLHAPRPVSACGMARLRNVLSDGLGPLYQYGRGDLTGRLGAALAEL
jgi:hypothetical protein